MVKMRDATPKILDSNMQGCDARARAPCWQCAEECRHLARWHAAALAGVVFEELVFFSGDGAECEPAGGGASQVGWARLCQMACLFSYLWPMGRRERSTAVKEAVFRGGGLLGWGRRWPARGSQSMRAEHDEVREHHTNERAARKE